MNTDEVMSLVRKVLLVGLTSLATRLHMEDVSWVLPVSTDLADLGVIAWGMYAHWGMKKVPDNSVTIPSPR